MFSVVMFSLSIFVTCLSAGLPVSELINHGTWLLPFIALRTCSASRTQNPLALGLTKKTKAFQIAGCFTIGGLEHIASSYLLTPSGLISPVMVWAHPCISLLSQTSGGSFVNLSIIPTICVMLSYSKSRRQSNSGVVGCDVLGMSEMVRLSGSK